MVARPRRRRRARPKSRLRRWFRRQDRFTRGLLVSVIALAVLVFALIAPRLNEEDRVTKSARGTLAGKSGSEEQARLTPAAQVPAARPQQKARAPQPVPPPKSLPVSLPVSLPAARPVAPRTPRTAPGRIVGPRVAIVIDDLGQSLSHLEQLADLNIPLSIAVIPGLPASARTVAEASRLGIEMLLHQPMEPLEEGGKNPGEGVLLTSMTTEALRAQVRANLAAVPGAVGVNNHMGSRFTADAAGLGAVMAELKEHGLFWLDSRTTAATRGVEAAHALGVPAISRDIFIDAEVNVDAIRSQVRRLVKAALIHGTAVGIGHPHPETIAVLRELRGELLAGGVTLVPLSKLVHKTPEIEPGTALAAALANKGGAGDPAVNRKPAAP